MSAKTNAMRILEQHGIPYAVFTYPHHNEPVDGVSVAGLIGEAPEKVFKTLIARGGSGGVYAFVIPVSGELNLKKAARAVGEKAVGMVPARDIFGLTGYVRGGCSPVGMKKPCPVVFHESAADFPAVTVSAGRIGLQIKAAPRDLLTLLDAKVSDLLL